MIQDLTEQLSRYRDKAPVSGPENGIDNNNNIHCWVVLDSIN